MTPGEQAFVAGAGLGVLVAGLVLWERSRQRRIQPADLPLILGILLVPMGIGALFLGPANVAVGVALLLLLATGGYLVVGDESTVRTYRHSRLAGWLLLAAAAVTIIGWLLSTVLRW